MSNTVIKVENLYKQYRLGEVGTGSMKDDIKRWRYKIMGREDPFLTIGEENDRTVKANSKYVWALKDINFEVQQGEILGIIGRNGAGKSTLLKILSRTTGPTKGSLKMKGRIASLLEVGTGFHGELSGRENIFLNGAIMGMNKAEVKRKLDEIIDFAGVEKYIDTPVKRYSSGMYVRLAFGVAAHLEPDIMIVDEVLAVGDAEFQKKALGKMKDVSIKGGRTVLFVSHNLIAVRKLCNSGIFLKNGRVSYQGGINNAIDNYIEDEQPLNLAHYKVNPIENKTYIEEIKVLNHQNEICSAFNFDSDITLFFKIAVKKEHLKSVFGFRVKDRFERNIFSSEIKLEQYIHSEGVHTFSVNIPNSLLAPNVYQLVVGLHVINQEIISIVENDICFEIIESGTNFIEYLGADTGCVLVDCKWSKVS